VRATTRRFFESNNEAVLREQQPTFILRFNAGRGDFPTRVGSAKAGNPPDWQTVRDSVACGRRREAFFLVPAAQGARQFFESNNELNKTTTTTATIVYLCSRILFSLLSN